jgi:fructose-bisphosphate aldolase class II
MFDGSQLPYEENVKKTKQVVSWAKKFRVSVEAEIGTIGGKEDKVSGGIEFTDPWQAAEFAKRTGCDSLAIGIGTSHGAFKAQAKNLRLDILREVTKRVKVPIVLHGASLVDASMIKKAKKSGIQIEKARGVSPKDIKKAIKDGICKVNVDTDLRLAFTSALRDYANKNPKTINPRDLLFSGEKAAEESVIKHIILFGSKGKA